MMSSHLAPCDSSTLAAWLSPHPADKLGAFARKGKHEKKFQMRDRMSADLPIWRALVMSTTGKSAKDRSTKCWRCRLSMVDILPSHGGFPTSFRMLLRLAQLQVPWSFRLHKRPALPRDAAGDRRPRESLCIKRPHVVPFLPRAAACVCLRGRIRSRRYFRCSSPRSCSPPDRLPTKSRTLS